MVNVDTLHLVFPLMLEAFLSSGRSTLQKRVMALLRRIEHPTPGNIDVTFSLVPDGDHDVSEWRF